MKRKQRLSSSLKYILLSVLLLIIIFFGLFKLFSYESLDSARSLIHSTKDYQVHDNKNSIYFSPVPNKTNSMPTIIFYNGALIEEEAYSPLASELAKNGFPVYVIKTLFNFPLLAPDDEIIDDLTEEDSIILMGHSLGGVQASYIAKELLDNKNSDSPDLSGLILLASYPADNTDLTNFNNPVLSITASEDDIINAEKYLNAKQLLPDETVYYTIQGGNHAGFGFYGAQRGDGDATISHDEQLQEIVHLINTTW